MIFWSLLFILFAIIIGFIDIWDKKKKLKNNIQFSDSFLIKLEDYVTSEGKDITPYDWMISHSRHMQIILGPIGVARHYIPPFANYKIPNYELIINTLPVLRQNMVFPSQLAYEYYRLIKEPILSYIGELDENQGKIINELRNPIVWFFTGISLLLSLPLRILQWAGLISSLFISNLEKNRLYKIFSSVVGIISFLASIISIIDGWDKVILIFKSVSNIIK